MKYYYEDNLGKLYESTYLINTSCNVILALKQLYTGNIDKKVNKLLLNSNTLTQVNIWNYYYKNIYNSSQCDKCKSSSKYCLWADGTSCFDKTKDACTSGTPPEGTWCGPTPPPPPTPPPTPAPLCSSYNTDISCCKNACNICPPKSINKLFTTSDCSNGKCAPTPVPAPSPDPGGDTRICIWKDNKCVPDTNPCPKAKPLPTNIKGFYQRFNWSDPPSMNPTGDPPTGCNLVVLFTGGEPGANLYRETADNSELVSYNCYLEPYPVLPTATWYGGSATIPVISDLAKGKQCGGCTVEEAKQHSGDQHFGGAGGPPENYDDNVLYFLCFSGGESQAAIRTIDLIELTNNILPRLNTVGNKYDGICFDWEGFNSTSGTNISPDKNGKPCPPELMQDNIDLVISTLKTIKQHGLLVMITTSGNAGTGQYWPGDPGNNIIRSIMDPKLVDIYSPQIYQQTNSSTLKKPIRWSGNGGVEIIEWANKGIRVVPSIVNGDISTFSNDYKDMGSKANDYIIW